MKYKNRPLQDWIIHEFNPIHLIGDYYLLRNWTKSKRKFSFYSIAKIRREVEE